ncbi:hypothetical protein CPC08DRAFT_706137 [Agrocybe pediades]|nr:hypothetical protein CPC08DRAFT_706137 [Agrocybe pediades]
MGVKADLCIERLQQIRSAQKRSIHQILMTSYGDVLKEMGGEQEEGEEGGEEREEEEREEEEREEEEGEEGEEGEEPDEEQSDPDQGAPTEEHPEVAFFKYTCNHCREVIPFEQTFYTCTGHSCEDYYMCKPCSTLRFEADGEHQWWHCLLALHPLVIEGELGVESTIEQSVSEDAIKTMVDDAPQQAQQPNLTTLEERLQLLESKVDERMSRLEGKMEIIMTGLQELLAKVAAPAPTS